MRGTQCLWLTALAGCFTPEFPVGLPCGPDCPPGQECRAGLCQLPIDDSPDAPVSTGDAGPDGAGAIDARPDAVGATDCWAAWLAGVPSFSAVREVSELSTGGFEGDPFLTADALTLYFSGTNGASRDFLVATRADRAAPFGPAAVVAELASPTDETRVSITADGLVAVFSRRVTVDNADLYEATRPSTSVPFGPPTTAPFVVLNDATNQHDPWVTGDGLRLYYAPSAFGGQQLRFAERASRTQSFGGSVALAGITPSTSVDPTLSPDERVIVYAGRDSSSAAIDLYTARRSTPSAPFTNVTPLAVLNTASADGDPAVSADGCELMFSSDRGLGGDRDIYTVTVLPD